MDSLVAPIALYPDPLLSHVLAASMYPLQVVEASQWLRDNPQIKGEELTKQAAKQGWDPSVEALITFPEALRRLSDSIKWTADLGDAFLHQPNDVAAAIQRMREKVKNGGKLESSKEQKVKVQDR